MKLRKRKKALTTSDVASICATGHSSVNRWCEKELIEFWRIPGSTHRRFTVEAVRKFISQNKIPGALARLEAWVEENQP